MGTLGSSALFGGAYAIQRLWIGRGLRDVVRCRFSSCELLSSAGRLERWRWRRDVGAVSSSIRKRK